MQIENLKLGVAGTNKIPCFMCREHMATNRVAMDINDNGNLMVCLCEKCLAKPEIEIYSHFMRRKGSP